METFTEPDPAERCAFNRLFWRSWHSWSIVVGGKGAVRVNETRLQG